MNNVRIEWEMRQVKRARNLDAIAWHDGYMLVRFKGRPDRYVFGPSIPRAEFDKVLANPYPDRLFTTNIKNKFQCHKVRL
jgi:hypothetical protein